MFVHVRLSRLFAPAALLASSLSSACADPVAAPIATCQIDRDCQDADRCNGLETCTAGRCQAGTAITCEADDQCLATGECGQLAPVTPACDAPRAPMLATLPGGIALPFDRPVELGTSVDPLAAAPSEWHDDSLIDLPDSGSVTVFARDPAGDPSCLFRATYDLVADPVIDNDDWLADAVRFDDPRIVGWAAGWIEPVLWGRDNDPDVEDPRRALGPAGRDALDATSLGNGGALTLVLPWSIGDGPGPEFAIFENGFSDQFLELAFVEVSSDGEHFARFDSLALDMEPVGPYGTLDARRVGGLAGRYKVGLGTPFDLALLAFNPEVRAGRVDLAAIAYVRVVDIIGDGATRDSFGAPIYDPTPTHGTAGFDLDGIAVLTP